MRISIPKEIDIVSWGGLFLMLSLDRCVPFFNELGLTPTIANNPLPIKLAARNYLQSIDEILTESRPNNLEEFILIYKNQLEEFFYRLEKGYDVETANFLLKWCLIFLPNSNSGESLSFWNSIFIRLCNSTQLDGSLEIENSSDSILTKICPFVHEHLGLHKRLIIKSFINRSRELPLTDWEKWIEEKEEKPFDSGASIDPIDRALDLVSSIANLNSTNNLWNFLVKQLSSNELAKLIAWGNSQAKVENLPFLLKTPPFEIL